MKITFEKIIIALGFVGAGLLFWGEQGRKQDHRETDIFVGSYVGGKSIRLSDIQKDPKRVAFYREVLSMIKTLPPRTLAALQG